MPHVEDGEKYYIRKEYTEVSQLGKGEEKQHVLQQGEEPEPPGSKGQEEGETDAG